MSVTQCRCCQLELQFAAGEEIRTCPACGMINALPKAEGPSLDVLRRANSQRLSCDFANAENSYQRVLLDYPEEHEALWGRLLCRYGVEYVEDPRMGRRTPVVHTVRRKPMQEEADFRAACEFAPSEVRAQYEEEAAYIDTAMLRIRQLAENGPAYDVFLCHKTTTLGGDGFTKDYARAVDLYHLLTSRGLQVFFAPKTLESAAGENYEAGIYHALCSAKNMLVICSDPRHLSSPWVMNEWQRFLEMADEDAGKRLIPLLYGDMPAGDLPREFRVRGLQAMLMGEMGAQEKLLAALLPAVPKPAPTPPVVHTVPAVPVQRPATAVQQPAPRPVYTPVSAPVPAPAPADPAALRRAGIQKLLTAARWDEARAEIASALEKDPTDAHLYLYQLMADLHISSEKELAGVHRPVENTAAWQNFVKHADATLCSRVTGYRKTAASLRTTGSIVGAIITFILTLAVPFLLTDTYIAPYSSDSLDSSSSMWILICISVVSLLVFLIFFFAFRKRGNIVLGSCIAFSALSLVGICTSGLLVNHCDEFFSLKGSEIVQFSDNVMIGMVIWMGLSAIWATIRVFRRIRKAD